VDSTLLVTPAEQDSLKLLRRLDDNRVPIVAAYRYWDPEAESDRLVLASPWVREKGSRSVYTAIQRALRAEPSLRLELSEITALTPDDSLVQALGRALWVQGSDRIARASSAGFGPHGPFHDLVVLRALPKDTHGEVKAGS
jgi:hypothetical protein